MGCLSHLPQLCCSALCVLNGGKETDTLGPGQPGAEGTINRSLEERMDLGGVGLRCGLGCPDGDAQQAGEEVWELVWKVMEPLIQIWEVGGGS